MSTPRNLWSAAFWQQWPRPAGSVWLAAALVAYCLTWCAWPYLERPQVYADLIAGEVGLSARDKAQDFRALYLFAGTTVILAFTLAAVTSRRTPGETARGVRRAYAGLFLLAAIPALYHWGAETSGKTCSPPWEGFVLVAGVAALALALRRYRDQLTAAHVWRVAGLTFLIVLAAGLDGAGAATLFARLAPGRCVGLAEKAGAWLCLMPAVLAVITVAGLILWTADLERLVTRLIRVLFAVQAGLPLLYAVLLPAPHAWGASVYRGRFSPALPVVLACFAGAALWSLGRRYRAWRRSADGAVAFRTLLAPWCLAAVPLFLRLPLPAPAVLSPDHFHLGEQLVPWQQLVDFGKVPYRDFVPAVGDAVVNGAVNHALFSGELETREEADRLLTGVALGALFGALFEFAGPFAALFITLFGWDAMIGGRLQFLVPCLLFLALPKLLSRPRAWLLCWLLVMPAAVFYNFASGAALALASLPVAVAMLVRLGRTSRLALLGCGAGAALAGGGLLAVPVCRQVLLGLLTFNLDSARTNGIAYGLPWSSGWGTAQPFRLFSASPLLWEALRLAWIPVAFLALYLAYREWSRPVAERRASMAVLGLLAGPTLFLLAGYALGRIEPGQLSRTNCVSFAALLLLVPAFLLARANPGRAVRLTAGLAVACGVLHDVRWQDSSVRLACTQPFFRHDLGAVPPALRLIRGEDEGLHGVGLVFAEEGCLEHVRRMHRAVFAFLGEDETFLDLTNQQALYCYWKLPLPTSYAAIYCAPTADMQRRLIDEVHRTRPPVVLLAHPGLARPIGDAYLTALRAYRLYRDLLQHYVPVECEGCLLLVEPGRVPTDPPLSGDERGRRVAVAFFSGELYQLPVAWGRSWEQLRPLFEPVALLTPSASPSDSSVPATSGGFHGDVVFDLARTPQGLDRPDFLRLDLAYEPGAASPPKRDAAGKATPTLRVEVFARSEHGEQRICGFTAERGPLLIPLGAHPYWLLADRVTALRLAITDAQPCREVSVREACLLRLVR